MSDRPDADDALDPEHLGRPFARPVIPVANEPDAVSTAAAAVPHLAAVDGRPLVVSVIEKAGGAPDKASVEQREAEAERAFAAFRDRAEAAGVSIETAIRYGTDVAEEVGAAAAESGASAIVFDPREASRLADLLTGNVRRRLVLESTVPVVVLPDRDENEGAGGSEGESESANGADREGGPDADATGSESP